VVRSLGMRRLACRSVSALSIALVGCAPLVDMGEPSPHGPRISHLRFVPSETRAGCLVNVRAQFESATEEVVSATFAWVVRHGRKAAYGRSTLPIDMAADAGDLAGEVVAQFTPSESGSYYGYVQVADRSGRMSNVLRGTLAVERPWTDAPPPCPEAR
jgi:hypothetical protein